MSIPLFYRIKNWDSIYENNRTRELKQLGWIALPLGHDGDGYTLLIGKESGAALFGAWISLVQVAARCDPRGTLMRRCGTPHTADSLSRITRIPTVVFETMLNVTLHECKWLELGLLQNDEFIPQEGAAIPQGGALDRIGQDRMGKENQERVGAGKGRVEKSKMAMPLDGFQLRLGRLFNRKATTQWSPDEIKAYRILSEPDEMDWVRLEAYYHFRWPQSADYRRRDLLTLLNNFAGELDRARKWKEPTCL